MTYNENVRTLAIDKEVHARLTAFVQKNDLKLAKWAERAITEKLDKEEKKMKK